MGFTDKQQDSLQRYFSEVDRIPRISAAEEARLAQLSRAGDRAAEQRLVRANLRFVISVAKRYEHLGVPLADLINEGNIGLMTAAGKFDETRGFKFISYAVNWIRQSIVSAVKEHGRTVRLPVARIDLQQQVYHAQIRLEQSFGRLPTRQELAEFLNEAEDHVQDALLEYHSFSVDRNFNDEQTFLDVMAIDEPLPDETFSAAAGNEFLRAALAALPEKQGRIISSSFGLGSFAEKSFPDIGYELKLSAEGVRQNYYKALAQLRANLLFKNYEKNPYSSCGPAVRRDHTSPGQST